MAIRSDEIRRVLKGVVCQSDDRNRRESNTRFYGNSGCMVVVTSASQKAVVMTSRLSIIGRWECANLTETM